LRNHGGDDVIKVVLGNKCDLTEKLDVTEEEIKELAESINAHYFIVSAYNNYNIVECFDFMANELMKR
jgi:GTPase SAR1 family protein